MVTLRGMRWCQHHSSAARHSSPYEVRSRSDCTQVVGNLDRGSWIPILSVATRDKSWVAFKPGGFSEGLSAPFLAEHAATKGAAPPAHDPPTLVSYTAPWSESAQSHLICIPQHPKWRTTQRGQVSCGTVERPATR